MLVKILRAIAERTPTFVMKFFFNIYPPYLGAGIAVEEISSDYRYLRVGLKLRFYNRNYVGTQFGGSLYSMTDPHYMFLLINNLGPDYVVWDKAARIDFVKPGRGHVFAEFKVTDSLLAEIRERTANGDKYIFDLPVSVKSATGDSAGEVVAELIKTMYVRRKRSK